MDELAVLNSTQLILAALAGLAVLLVLIIKFKVPALVAILIGAVVIGFGAGMSVEDIIGSVNEGVGNTLKNIALLVGLGSMFGSILEISGGAQVLATTLLDRFGDKKAAITLGVTGMIVAVPVFSMRDL